ncbi:hypothetical protein B4144_0283 [Bacillus atrophaeus]|nr:hypothetical protein D068_cds02810 [Bacillus atrophaeus UCMB-5137]KYD05725.1 hypothetical protein B4144_0283 [Bacillus atrophaeus]
MQHYFYKKTPLRADQQFFAYLKKLLTSLNGDVFSVLFPS